MAVDLKSFADLRLRAALFFILLIYPCHDRAHSARGQQPDPVPMDRTLIAFITRWPLLFAAVFMFCGTGCSQQQSRDIARQFSDGKPDEFFQTSVDRMATLSMRDNLKSLYLLMNKLSKLY